MRKTQPKFAGFEDEGKGNAPKDMGGLQELEKAREQILP